MNNVTLKIKIWRMHMAVTLNWYMQKLAEDFGQIANNEAKREIMRREFDKLHQTKMRAEKTNSWQVPLKLIFFDNGLYNVVIEDNNKVLFLDD